MSGPRGKESALDLAKFVDKSIRVKLAGGREGEGTIAVCEGSVAQWRGSCQACLQQRRVAAHARPPAHLRPALLRCSPHQPPAVVGVLKGYDQLMNLVLDEAVEYLRGEMFRCHVCVFHLTHMSRWLSSFWLSLCSQSVR